MYSTSQDISINLGRLGGQPDSERGESRHTQSAQSNPRWAAHWHWTGTGHFKSWLPHTSKHGISDRESHIEFKITRVCLCSTTSFAPNIWKYMDQYILSGSHQTSIYSQSLTFRSGRQTEQLTLELAKKPLTCDEICLRLDQVRYNARNRFRAGFRCIGSNSHELLIPISLHGW